jgi:hypothetical protein
MSCIRSSAVVALVVAAASSSSSCGIIRQCASFSDCEPGFICSKDGACVEDTSPDPFECQPGGETEVLLPFGLPQNARYWVCENPAPSDAPAKFTDFSGPPAIVNGGSIVLKLDFEGTDDLAGRTLVFSFQDDGVVFTKDLPADEPLPSPLTIELFASRTAPPGLNPLRIGIEDGTSRYDEGKIGVGEYLTIPLNFIPVRGGDVQVSISWDNSNDVDLHVFDPAGFEIYYAARTSDSGGNLDLDSNVGCNPGPQNENIYWATGTAPEGEYKIVLHLYTSCTTSGTSVRVNLLKDETIVTPYDVVLYPTETGDGTNPYVEVATFSWP